MSRNSHAAPLTLRQAAEIIFKTSNPTVEQLVATKQAMATGRLRGNTQRKVASRWTTSAEAVAEYLAALSFAARERKDDRTPKYNPSGEEEEQISLVYQDFLKDYFLAVLFRRRTKRASKRFRQAVVAGQAILLLAIVAAFLATVRSFHRPPSPEQAAVMDWIAARSDRYEIQEWFPSVKESDSSGTIVRVAYRYYRDGRRAVETERRFLVEQGIAIMLDPDN